MVVLILRVKSRMAENVRRQPARPGATIEGTQVAPTLVPLFPRPRGSPVSDVTGPLTDNGRVEVRITCPFIGTQHTRACVAQSALLRRFPVKVYDVVFCGIFFASLVIGYVHFKEARQVGVV